MPNVIVNVQSWVTCDNKNYIKVLCFQRNEELFCEIKRDTIRKLDTNCFWNRVIILTYNANMASFWKDTSLYAFTFYLCTDIAKLGGDCLCLGYTLFALFFFYIGFYLKIKINIFNQTRCWFRILLVIFFLF